MVILLSKLVCLLPLRLALFIGRAFGWIWYYLIPIRRSVATANVRRALGADLPAREVRRIVRGSFENLAMNAIETLRAPLFDLELSKELVERQGVEHIEAAWQQGKGVLYLLSHVGNVDMIGFSQPCRGLPLHGVVKEITWGPAQAFVRRVRERTGLKLIAPRRSKNEIKQVLAANEMVGLVSDQHMPAHRGVVCEFFGSLASTSTALARFGFETGAPILPAVMVRQGRPGHFLLRIEPEFLLEAPHADHAENVRHNSERLNRILERWIRDFPEQWLWAHKRWKVHEDPDAWQIPANLRHHIDPPR